MTRNHDHDDAPRSRAISRRAFVKLAAVAGLLAGCSPVEQLVTPTNPKATSSPLPPPTPTPIPTETPLPAPTATLTIAPSATPTVLPTLTPFAGRPAVIKMYPEAPSRVVRTHHAGVWSKDTLVPGALRQMLDASITKLTGLNDAKDAWAALFKPNERIAIKVNTFRNSIIWTHTPLVTAVTQCLQEAGIPAKQIVIFDFYTEELKEAGYTVNRDGPGVRCYGSDDDYTGGWQVEGASLKLSNILLNCNAVINMPVLKAHSSACGLTFALKNHFGSVSRPLSLHEFIIRKTVALNALPPIRERTRLIIGDVLAVAIRIRDELPFWKPDVKGDSIAMSFDPVALDTVAVPILNQLRAEKGDPPVGITPVTANSLPFAARLGLGTNDEKNIQLMETTLK